MNYDFPEISTFSDVEHAIDRKMFVVAERNGYTIINYLYASPDVFPDIDPTCDIAKIRREFRGLIFDEAGKIIRRPFHKFFNVGERFDTQLANIDVSRPHLIYDKLDGSMIAPYRVGIDTIWGTKMGYTEVSKQAEAFVNQSKTNYKGFADTWLNVGYTPIFEWCARSQRIVLDYKEDQLVLTAMRDMKTGIYCQHEELLDAVAPFNIPVCPVTAGERFSDDFLQKTKQAQDIEGFVIRFDDGHMAKIKCDWYCQLHRVKSDIQFERGVVALLLNEAMDDIKPLMASEDLAAVDEYEEQFIVAFASAVETVRKQLEDIALYDISRKGFALDIAPQLAVYEKVIIFKLFDNSEATTKDIADMLRDVILSHTTKNTKFDELRKTKLFENVKPWRGTYTDE